MIVYILANPHAGNGSAVQRIDQLEKDYPDLQLKSYFTAEKNDEYGLVKEILSHFRVAEDRLLILGGDGTLSKVLSVLPEEIPFAYFPTGSGNDFARAMGIFSLDQVIHSLREGNPIRISVLQSDHGVIVNSLDMGYSAQVIAYSERFRLKKWLNRIKLGKITYVLFGVLSLIRHPRLSVRIEKEGESIQLEELFFLSFANNTYFGGGIMIWPEASAKTVQIDVVYFRAKYFLSRVGALLDLLLKKHQSSPYLQHFTAKELTAYLPAAIAVQMDGELKEIQEITLRCQKRYLYL